MPVHYAAFEQPCVYVDAAGANREAIVLMTDAKNRAELRLLDGLHLFTLPNVPHSRHRTPHSWRFPPSDRRFTDLNE